jgi:hypothetical protein
MVGWLPFPSGRLELAPQGLQPCTPKEPWITCPWLYKDWFGRVVYDEWKAGKGRFMKNYILNGILSGRRVDDRIQLYFPNFEGNRNPTSIGEICESGAQPSLPGPMPAAAPQP